MGFICNYSRDFFLLLLAWTPLVLSFTFPKLKLAPGSQAGPVFMSLRLGQYFSVEPDRRDPLYKTLTKNRQPPCPQARSPPAPRMEHSPWSVQKQPHQPPGQQGSPELPLELVQAPGPAASYGLLERGRGTSRCPAPSWVGTLP